MSCPFEVCHPLFLRLMQKVVAILNHKGSLRRDALPKRRRGYASASSHFALFLFLLACSSFCSSCLRIVSRPSFLRVKSITSSVLMVVLPACLAKASRSMAAFPVQPHLSELKIHLPERGKRGAVPTCAQTNSIRLPINCGVAFTPRLMLSSSTILPIWNQSAERSFWRVDDRSAQWLSRSAGQDAVIPSGRTNGFRAQEGTRLPVQTGNEPFAKPPPRCPLLQPFSLIAGSKCWIETAGRSVHGK